MTTKHTTGPWLTWVESLDEVGEPMRRKAALLDQALQELEEDHRDYEATLELFARDVETHWPGTILPAVVPGCKGEPR